MRRRPPKAPPNNSEPAPRYLIDPMVEDFVEPGEHLVGIELLVANQRLFDARRQWDRAHPLPAAPDPLDSVAVHLPCAVPADQRPRFNTSFGELTISELRMAELGDSCRWAEPDDLVVGSE